MADESCAQTGTEQLDRGAAILLVNALGAQWDIFIPLNILNALIVGVLGLPGAVLLLILQ